MVVVVTNVFSVKILFSNSLLVLSKHTSMSVVAVLFMFDKSDRIGSVPTIRVSIRFHEQP